MDLQACLESKEGLLARYLSITEKLQDALAVGKGKQMRSLLSQRQYCIKRIDNINAAMSNGIEGDSGPSAVVPASLDEKAAAVLSRIRNLIRAIGRLDQRIMDHADSELGQLRQSLLRSWHRREATRGYGHSAKTGLQLMHIKG